MGFSLKKTIKKVGKPLAAISTGGLSLLGGVLKNPKMPQFGDGSSDIAALNAMAEEEARKRQELATTQRGQIEEFGKQYSTDAASYRQRLADSLAATGQKTFEAANPYILEDLHSRGFASSPTEVGRAQATALGDIARENQSILTNFDTDSFNTLQDIRGGGLNQFLGGNQDALDSALELRRSGISRSFDTADRARDDAMSKYLAKRQSRDNLISGITGAGTSLLAGLCFAPETPIEMADGGTRPIGDVRLGDYTRAGMVLSVRRAFTDELYSYAGLVSVTGSHCVLEQDGWKRVADSPLAKPIDGRHIIVSLITEDHRIYAKGFTFDDESESIADITTEHVDYLNGAMAANGR